MKIAYRRVSPAFLQVVSEELPAEQLPVAQCNLGRSIMTEFDQLPIVQTSEVPEIWIDGIAYIEAAAGNTLRVVLFAKETVHGIKGDAFDEKRIKIAIRGSMENLPAVIHALAEHIARSAARKVSDGMIRLLS